MEIRRAIREDIEPLVQLIERLGSDKEIACSRANRIATDEEIVILIYREASGLSGYLGIKEYDYDKRAKKFVNLNINALINWIGVDSDFRHQGIGSKLLCLADDVAKKWGKSGIWLDCKAEIIPFYVSNGYRARGSYFDKAKPRYIMLKRF